MPRKKKVEIITEAKPHTIKKFELIEKYVDAWARKILGYNGKDGVSGSKGIIYIDCMSNSGVYKDGLGNLIEGTALRVARRLDEIIQNYPGKEAIILFNDIEKERIEYLEKEIEKAELTHVRIRFFHDDCNVFLRSLNLDGFRNKYNTLLIYDPYKAFIDWDAVTPFLNCWGEVIFNHMVSDTSRGASQARKTKVIERYQNVYQCEIDEIIELGNNKHELNKIVISNISKRRDNNLSQQYVASFPFFNRTNGLVYNLIHCCSNIEGIKLFKKVAWKTFGDRSSLKNTHTNDNQYRLDMNGELSLGTDEDEDCYNVADIAKYIHDKYSKRSNVDIKEIYEDLDVHPIFPSDGYKDKVKAVLKSTYGVVFHRGGNVEF